MKKPTLPLSTFSAPPPMDSSSSPSSSQPQKAPPGEIQDDLAHIEVKFDKATDEPSATQPPKSAVNHSNKHSPVISTNANAGFSLKNPVSSFRSWVTNKKSSKDDSTVPPESTYKKIDTTPIPRKNSVESDSSKRARTNSASISTSTAVNHSQEATNPPSTRVKKKSSFSLRSNNPMALLKRTSDTTGANTNELESNEQTSGTGGPLDYLKNLVRGEKQ